MQRSHVFAATVLLAVAGWSPARVRESPPPTGRFCLQPHPGRRRALIIHHRCPPPAFSAPAGQRVRVTVAQGCPTDDAVGDHRRREPRRSGP